MFLCSSASHKRRCAIQSSINAWKLVDSLGRPTIMGTRRNTLLLPLNIFRVSKVGRLHGWVHCQWHAWYQRSRGGRSHVLTAYQTRQFDAISVTYESTPCNFPVPGNDSPEALNHAEQSILVWTKLLRLLRNRSSRRDFITPGVYQVPRVVSWPPGNLHSRNTQQETQLM